MIFSYTNPYVYVCLPFVAVFFEFFGFSAKYMKLVECYFACIQLHMLHDCIYPVYTSLLVSAECITHVYFFGILILFLHMEFLVSLHMNNIQPNFVGNIFITTKCSVFQNQFVRCCLPKSQITIAINQTDFCTQLFLSWSSYNSWK